MKLLTIREELTLGVDERLEYYKNLRKYVTENQTDAHFYNFMRSIYYRITPMMRKYPVDKTCIFGEENVPKDSPCVFLLNHSNSHDFYSGLEFIHMLGKNPVILAGSDCLTPVQQQLFKMGKSVLIDRKSESDCSKGDAKLVANVLHGDDLVIFGEATWNLHPTEPMLPIHIGAVLTAAKANIPIVPGIIEYVEKPEICKKESELYKKVIVRFGKPIDEVVKKDPIATCNQVQKEMEEMRREIWCGEGIKKLKLSDIDPEIYINHTHLKKNSPLFTLDADYEAQFIRTTNGKPTENEHVNQNGVLVPKIKILTK